MEVNKIIHELRETIWAGFRQTPYVDHVDGVFRSHFDWHSSVHAHWSLLSSSRYLKDQESAQKILSRISEASLLEVHKRLLETPKFELPYGQAWLLLLISELENHGRSDQALRQLKTETVSRIGHWLESNEFPEKKVNSYHSWLITYFLFKKSKSDSLYSRAQIIHEKFYSTLSVHDEDDPKDFFSSESLFQILKHQPKKSLHLAPKLYALGTISRHNCHHLGKIISMTWTAPENQEGALESTVAAINEILKQPHLWKEDFETVSHWIPQFLWFGLWLSLGSH